MRDLKELQLCLIQGQHCLLAWFLRITQKCIYFDVLSKINISKLKTRLIDYTWATNMMRLMFGIVPQKWKFVLFQTNVLLFFFLQRNTSWNISYSFRILYVTQINWTTCFILFYFFLHKAMTVWIGVRKRAVSRIFKSVYLYFSTFGNFHAKQ